MPFLCVYGSIKEVLTESYRLTSSIDYNWIRGFPSVVICFACVHCNGDFRNTLQCLVFGLRLEVFYYSFFRNLSSKAFPICSNLSVILF